MSLPVFFITGASRGFGFLLVQAAARSGYRVVGTVRSAAQIPELTKALGPLANVVRFAVCDLSKPDTLEAVVRELLQNEGRVDVLVNNAGVGVFGPLELLPMERLRAQMETNFFGLAQLTQHVIPLMRRQGGGRIINISSIAGRFAFPNMGAYHASKFALEGYSESLARELRGEGIFVSLVEPGRFATGFSTHSTTEFVADSDVYYATMQKRLHEKRSAFPGVDPAPVARAVMKAVLSCSPRLRYVVGRDAKALIWFHRFSPAFIFERVMHWAFYGEWRWSWKKKISSKI